MLLIEQLSVRRVTTPVLREVSLRVPAGSFCALVGRNGAGKTTLLRTVMGQLRVDSGHMRFADNTDLQHLPAHHRARLGIGYMPEDRRLVPTLSVEDNILLPMWATQQPHLTARLAWIYNLMPELDALRQRSATQLSGGQQKLIALARAILVGEKLLLLDEPLEGIAPLLAQRMLAVLSELKQQGLSVLVAESSSQHLADLSRHCYYMERGIIQEFT